jgi:hypothetical protein
MAAKRRGSWAFALALAAVAWGAALVVAAFAAPAYNDGSTLAAQNGAWVALPVSFPAVLAGVAWLGLHRRCSRGSRAGWRLAWASIALLAAFAILTVLSIGIFVVPVAALLVAAATLTPAAPS